MNPTTTNVDVITHNGHRLTVRRVQHWIDASSKDDPHARAPGKAELRTLGGAVIPFDGEVFTLPDGDMFDAPAT